MRTPAMWFMLFATLVARVDALELGVLEMNGKRFTTCRVDVRKERLQLFLNDDVGQPFKRFERLTKTLEAKNRKLTFAMNAGMYDQSFRPVGLTVVDGKEVSTLNTSTGEGNFFLKPNGVFLVSNSGARVVETAEYPSITERANIATQSGPLLLRAGKMHPAFNPDSKNRLIRNGVGIPSPDIVIFVISEDPVNFHEFASMFRDKLHCHDALYLDGVISSLHAPKLGRSDSRMDLGPILAITE